MTIDELEAGRAGMTDARKATLAAAIEAGADDKTLVLLRDSVRVRRRETIILPIEPLELCSRGKGWCRKGRGDSAEWAKRVEGGYEAGPGRWTVGGNDGFTRKRQTEWTVTAVKVGGETWTIAN